jgi:hypothetical protein
VLRTIAAAAASAPTAFAARFALLPLLRKRRSVVVAFHSFLPGLLWTRRLGLVWWTRRLRFSVPLLSGVLRIFVAAGFRAPLTTIFAAAPAYALAFAPWLACWRASFGARAMTLLM